MDEKYANIQKNADLSGRPFRVLGWNIDSETGTVNFREEFHTGYAFYMHKRGAGKVEHLIGKWEDGKFMVRPKFSGTAEFREANWKDYEFTNEDTNKVENYFKKQFAGSIEFAEPETMSLWDVESKSVRPMEVTKAWVLFTPNQYEKICEALHDKRSNASDYIVMTYKEKNPPATKYTVAWHDEFLGEVEGSSGSTGGTTAVSVGTVTLSDEELTALADIEGVDVTTDSLIEYLMTHDDLSGTITPERAREVALSVGATGTVVIAA